MIWFIFFCLFVLFNNANGTEKPKYLFPTTTGISFTKPYLIFLNNSFPNTIKLLSTFNESDPTAYNDLTDVRIGFPMYGGWNQQKSRRILVESFFNHFRTLDSIKKSILSKRICDSKPGINTTIIPSSKRIVSIFHEINLPFEVDCFSCNLKTLNEPLTKVFRILDNRNVFFLDKSLIQKSKSIPEILTEKIQQESLTKVFFIERDYGKTGRLQFNPRIIPELTLDPESPEKNPSTELSENSGSIFCAKENPKGELIPVDVIVNVDTLRIPPPKINVLDEKTDPDPGNDLHRFKIEDLIVWTSKFDKQLPIIDEKLNLKLDLRWEKWSCCSACCCTIQTCETNFDVSQASCKQISSYKSRRGFISFFKVDPKISLNFTVEMVDYMKNHESITDSMKNEVIETMELLDVYLSSDPYSEIGIPFSSTLLQNSRPFLLLESFLNEKFHYRNENSSENGIFGRYGMMIENKNCETDKQKIDCTILQKCMDSNGFDDEIDDNEQITNDSVEIQRQNICKFPGIETILIKNQENSIIVQEDLSYRFLIDENEFGKLLSTEWMIGQREVSEFSKEKSCDEQRIFVDAMELNIIKVEKTDSMTPYIARGTLKDTAEEIVLKMVLNFKPKSTSSKYIAQLIKWSLISGGVLVIFVVSVIIIHCIQIRNLKKKLEELQKIQSNKTTIKAIQENQKLSVEDQKQSGEVFIQNFQENKNSADVAVANQFKNDINIENPDQNVKQSNENPGIVSPTNNQSQNPNP